MRESPAAVRPALDLDTSASARFLISQPSFAPQYAHVYFCRLCALRASALASAHAAWGPATSSLLYADRIADIRPRAPDTKTETVVVGVLFRSMASKPSILRQYAVVSNELIPPPPGRSTTPYSGADDSLSIEDENGRCALDASRLEPTRALATGVVVAVRGFESVESGCFVAMSVALPGAPPPRALPAAEGAGCVAFVSGLSLGVDAPVGGGVAIELLLEFLKGNVGTSAERVSLLVVAGGLIGGRNAACVRDPQAAVDDDAKASAASPLVEADRFLTAAAGCVPVLLLPGAGDPANYILPQQPLHRCLLPTASRCANLRRVPNPAAVEVGGRTLLGSAGQPVGDLALYGEAPERKGKKEKEDVGEGLLDCMQAMLEARHVAPTCPDTLASYPFAKEDPFVIAETPSVFFAGNQDVFASRMYSGKGVKGEDGEEEVRCRMVCVPRFSETGKIAMVSLDSLECTVREFNMDF